jgi:hypothetical protein
MTKQLNFKNMPHNNNNVVEKINTTKNKQYLVGLLKNLGITELTASKLVLDYPHKRIIAQVEMLPYRQAQNPAGMLIKAIKENWAPPQAYNEFQQQKARQRAEEEKRAKEEAIRKVRQQQIVALKAKMSEQELQELRERAEQKIPDVLKNAYRAKKLPLPEILIEAQMNYIIGKEYLT